MIPRKNGNAQLLFLLPEGEGQDEGERTRILIVAINYFLPSPSLIRLRPLVLKAQPDIISQPQSGW
jgi:hypothetical protein